MAAADVGGSGSSLTDALSRFSPDRAGLDAYALVETLYPICRSITGNGFRQSLRAIQQVVDLEVNEVSSGTSVFDWTVPNEWNIRDAYVKNRHGERVVDFQRSNLHVLNYSIPIHRTISRNELGSHLHTLVDAPDWIPYRTSYYRQTWGFCLSQRQLDQLNDDEYEVYIDSSLAPGYLTYGEYRIQGATDDEVLISCHSCHPSLCNDNLSGMSVAAELARLLTGTGTRYSYRFLWIPGTIGAITWLALHEAVLPRIRHGLVLSCVGDEGPFTYKRSRRGHADIDRAVAHVLRTSGRRHELRDFIPYGYDERQYCSPGINLPVGCFMRTPNGEYPQYHTSADDLSLVTPAALADSLQQLLRVLHVVEENRHYINQQPKGEPQLGRRGLYRQMGGLKDAAVREMAMLWVLNYSDGAHDLLDIAERAGLTFGEINDAARLLQQSGLLQLSEETSNASEG